MFHVSLLSSIISGRLLPLQSLWSWHKEIETWEIGFLMSTSALEAMWRSVGISDELSVIFYAAVFFSFPQFG